MKIKLCLISVCFVLLASVINFSQTTVDDDSDIVGWSDANLIVPLVKGDEKGKRLIN